MPNCFAMLFHFSYAKMCIIQIKSHGSTNSYHYINHIDYRFMLDISPMFIAMLLGTGFIAGIINVMAGGGSNLTLPALMIMGLPADIANATNRVGVFLQCLVGIKGFNHHGKLEKSDAGPILVPTLLGAGVGAVCASYFPNSYLKPALLITMVSMSLVILIKPSAVIPAIGEPHTELKRYSNAWWTLFFAGIYGGFVQAGVGFILLAALAGGLRYDLVRANALKLVCTAMLTSIALGIFIWRGQVQWIPGLVLAAGTMAGAQIGVNLALSVSQNMMKWFLFIMTLFASAAALWF